MAETKHDSKASSKPGNTARDEEGRFADKTDGKTGKTAGTGSHGKPADAKSMSKSDDHRAKSR